MKLSKINGELHFSEEKNRAHLWHEKSEIGITIFIGL